MEQTATTQQLPATVPALNLNAETIRQTFATIKEKQVRACAAMSKITAITSDAEDQAANDLLAKVRLTLEGKEGIQGIIPMRKEITRELDAMSQLLMEPEKAIITEGERVKQLRNAYAAEKVKQQADESARIERERQQANEISRIKAAMRESVATGIVTIVTDLNERVRQFVGGMTLANWDSEVVKLNAKPNLKEEKYQSFFAVPYDDTIITLDMFAACIAEVQKDRPYHLANAQYVESANGVLKMWIDDLPKLKMELQAAAEMKDVHPVESSEVRQNVAAQIDSKANMTAQTLQQQQATAAAEIARQRQSEQVQNEVKAQVQQQATAPIKGIRKGRVAIIENDAFYLEHTLTQLLKACLSHPKFPGHLKRDRKGALVPTDKHGNPVYADWLSELLTFAAKEVDTDIPGIAWKETVSTIVKS